MRVPFALPFGSGRCLRPARLITASRRRNHLACGGECVGRSATPAILGRACTSAADGPSAYAHGPLLDKRTSEALQLTFSFSRRDCSTQVDTQRSSTPSAVPYSRTQCKVTGKKSVCRCRISRNAPQSADLRWHAGRARARTAKCNETTDMRSGARRPEGRDMGYGIWDILPIFDRIFDDYLR